MNRTDQCQYLHNKDNDHCTLLLLFCDVHTLILHGQVKHKKK